MPDDDHVSSTPSRQSRVARLTAWGTAVVVGLAAAALGVWNLVDRAPPAAEAVASSATFDASRLLALVDADMSATAYADGVLHPLGDPQDRLVSLFDPADDEPARREADVQNTVLGWPGSLAVAPDGAHAYVVSSRGSPGPSVEAYPNGVFEGLPTTRTLTTVHLDLGETSVSEVCHRPVSVDPAPSGDWLLVACADRGAELAVVPLVDSRPGPVRVFDLEIPVFTDGDANAGASYAVIHPDGAAAGIVLENSAVGLVRFSLDDAGTPEAATAEPPTELDGWLTVARWTSAGEHLLVADVGWGPDPLDAVLNGAGAIVSLALSPDDDVRGAVSRAEVSTSPEAFELNRDGTLLVAVNMERTYLPSGFPTGLFPGRSASSLSLVEVDAASGQLKTLGPPLGFRGVLPEDAVFDADGDQVAVAVFQDHDAPRSAGWVELVDVDTTGPEPRLQRTGRRIPLSRGVHDLAVVD